MSEEQAGRRECQAVEYTVVLRARSSARFKPDQDWQLTLAIPQVEPNHVIARVFTRWIRDGLREAPRELVLEVCGPAESLDEAVRRFSVIGRHLATLVAFVANVVVEVPQVHLAFDSSLHHEERDFRQFLLPEETGPVSEGRLVRIDLLQAVSNAASLLDYETPRVGRALAHYRLALEHWVVGGESLALNYLWIAVENLTTVVVRRKAVENGISDKELAHHYHVTTDDPARPRWKQELGARIRKEVIFSGDGDAYKAAKSASDQLEHGFADLLKIHAQASSTVDATFHYVRRTICEMLKLPLDVTRELLSLGPLDVQSRRTMIRGKLLGSANHPAADGQLFPILDWRAILAKTRWQGDEFQAYYRHQVRVLIHPNVQFQALSYEVLGRSKEGVPTRGIPDESVSAEVTAGPLSEGLAESVMALVNTAIESSADGLQTFASVYALLSFGQAISYFQAAITLAETQLPMEAFPSVRSLAIIAARFEAMTDPAGPGLGIAIRAVIDALVDCATDPPSAASVVEQVEVRASSAGITVPTAMPAPETATIYRSLQEEIDMAVHVASSSYMGTQGHLVPDGDTIAFQVRIAQTPLIDLIVSTAAIAMLETLGHAVRLFDWRTDNVTFEATLLRARDVRKGAIEEWDSLLRQ